MPYICKDALDVLIDEQPQLSKLYLCLVDVMDYKTCIAGISYRINQKFLEERLTVAGVNGRKHQIPTRQKVRSVLSRMAKVNLIVDQGKHVFLLPFEKAHNSDQKRYNQRFNQSNNLNDTSKNSSDSVTCESPESRNNQGCNPRYNPHLYNNINSEKIGDSVERFAMHLDWQYNRDWIKRYLAKREDDPAKIDIDWVFEYQGHWSARPHIQKSQQEWDVHLANYLSQFIRNPKKFDDLNGFGDYKFKAVRGGNNQAVTKGFIPALPQYDQALPQYAQQNGFPACGQGKTWKQYRGLLQSLRTQRIDALQSANAAKGAR